MIWIIAMLAAHGGNYHLLCFFLLYSKITTTENKNAYRNQKLYSFRHKSFTMNAKPIRENYDEIRFFSLKHIEYCVSCCLNLMFSRAYSSLYVSLKLNFKLKSLTKRRGEKGRKKWNAPV